jgi:hypothetical protein
MNEKSPALPKAQVGKSYFSWLLWLIPIAAALLCAWLGQWPHSFTRLFALIRSALWQNCELRSLLEVSGTADPPRP